MATKRTLSNEKFLQANPETAHGTPLGTFLRSFLEAAYWTSDEEIGSSKELNQFNRTALVSVIEQCQQFIKLTREMGILPLDVDMSQAGHDFWLTRNGHGAGFWDRDEDVYGEGNGDKLSALCGLTEMFGGIDLERSGRGCTAKISMMPMYNEDTQPEKYKEYYKG